MTPPAAPTLHPKRCETCENTECNLCPLLQKANDGAVRLEIGLQRECISRRGCCSHSSTPDADARQRIEDVVKELERRLAQSKRLRTYFTSEECARTDGYESGLESAIALLKDGVERK